MWFNISSGIVVPWILGLWLIKRDRNLVLRISPFVWTISTLVCLWGDFNKYWILKPKLRKNQYLTTMPFNFGLIPIPVY